MVSNSCDGGETNVRNSDTLRAFHAYIARYHTHSMTLVCIQAYDIQHIIVHIMLLAID